MSKHNFLKGQLLNYHEQLQQMQGNVVEMLLFSRIREFYNEYGIRIETLMKERFELLCKYHETELKKDEQGNEYPSLVWEENDKGQKVRYKIREGMTYEEFQQAYQQWAGSPLGNTLTLVN